MDLAGKWYDLQVKRGLITARGPKAKQNFIRNAVNGVGASRPMTKAQLQSAVDNARQALKAMGMTLG